MGVAQRHVSPQVCLNCLPETDDAANEIYSCEKKKITFIGFINREKIAMQK